MQSAATAMQLRAPGPAAGQAQPAAVHRWRAFASAPQHKQGQQQQLHLLRAKRQEAEEDSPKASGSQEKGDADDGKYPEKNVWTGGWFGGEKGVQQFVAEFEAEPSAAQKKEIKKAAEKDPNLVNVSFQGRKVAARRVGDTGKDPIYIGARKGAEKDDASPQYLVDDERKYPARESLGPLSGVVGGFAGGERGVQQFVEQGEVTIAEKGRKQSSPLVFAGIVAVLGTAGTLFLTGVEEAGEEIYEDIEKADFSGGAATVQSVGRSVSAIDPSTKLALEVGLAALGGALLLVLGKKAAVGVANGAREGASSLLKLALFWGVVVLAAKFVIES